MLLFFHVVKTHIFAASLLIVPPMLRCVCPMLLGVQQLLSGGHFGGLGGPGGPARKPFQKVGGEAPPPSGMVSAAPGAAQSPKMTGFRSLKN